MKRLIILLAVVISACNQREEILISEDNFIKADNNELQIISPKFGDLWKPSTTQFIKWSLSKEVKKVQILLYRKETLVDFLAISYPNTGEFIWNISQQIKNSVHYRIKIIAVDYPRINKISEYFYIKDEYGDNKFD